MIVSGIWLFFRYGEPGGPQTVRSRATTGSLGSITNSASAGLPSADEKPGVLDSAKKSSKNRKNMGFGGVAEVSANTLRNVEEASARGVLGAALTPQEANWMDAQGMLAPSMTMFDRYRGRSLEELKVLAEKGSVPAAVVGALKIREDIFKSDDMSHLSKAGSRDDEKPQSEKLSAYLDSPEMQQQRAFLWQAVLHGSSYAAWSMASTYTDPNGGRCLKTNMCDAWSLVAWRMGDWKVVPPPSGTAGRPSSLYGVLAVANRLWADLNEGRAEQGLSPLRIDLRPAYDKWIEMQQNPDKAVPVYLR